MKEFDKISISDNSYSPVINIEANKDNINNSQINIDDLESENKIFNFNVNNINANKNN